MRVAIIGGMAAKDSGLLKLCRDWEFWGLNTCLPEWLGKKYVRLDKWFHLHRRCDLAKEIPQHLDKFEEWANKHDEIEIVLLEPWATLPNATVLPRAALEEMPRGNYHCGSFDWMLAYALHLGAAEIFLTGIQLHTQSGEPISSGPCLEYWCGYAEGRGVRVTVAYDCDLFWNYRLVRDHKRYGYDSWDLIEEVS